MERTLIKDLNQYIDQEVTIQGWMHTLRDQKNMQFMIIRDRTGLVQVAHFKKGNPELAETISMLGTESALSISGKVVENKIVKLGGIEIQLEDLVVEGAADIPLPFEPFGEYLPDQDFRLDDLRPLLLVGIEPDDPLRDLRRIIGEAQRDQLRREPELTVEVLFLGLRRAGRDQAGGRGETAHQAA